MLNKFFLKISVFLPAITLIAIDFLLKFTFFNSLKTFVNSRGRVANIIKSKLFLSFISLIELKNFIFLILFLFLSIEFFFFIYNTDGIILRVRPSGH